MSERSSGRVQIKQTGSEIVLPDLVIGTGRRIVFRISDANYQLERAKRIIIGVIAKDGHYARAAPAPSGTGEYRYAVTIPLGVPVDTLLGSGEFAISDTSGRPLPIGLRGPAIDAAGVQGSETVINLRIE